MTRHYFHVNFSDDFSLINKIVECFGRESIFQLLKCYYISVKNLEICQILFRVLIQSFYILDIFFINLLGKDMG